MKGFVVKLGPVVKKSSVSIAGPFWRIIRLALHETDYSVICFETELFYNRLLTAGRNPETPKVEKNV